MAARVRGCRSAAGLVPNASLLRSAPLLHGDHVVGVVCDQAEVNLVLCSIDIKLDGDPGSDSLPVWGLLQKDTGDPPGAARGDSHTATLSVRTHRRQRHGVAENAVKDGVRVKR